ncbi:MAG: hypothetical protein CMA60_00045 [Euryarchaeota archaeon]|nr:hypothetical protein [Euryarchaeota archaeon]
MTEIPPMNPVASFILEEQYIKRIPNLTEPEFMKYVTNLFYRANKPKREGALLTRSIHLWLAKLEGAGGKGKQLLPVGVQIQGQLAREFNTQSQPPIILERDYPGATLEQATNIFKAQALELFRTELRSSSIGPNITALIKPKPITTLNSTKEGVEQDFVASQQMMRTRYANTVLPILDTIVDGNSVVIFDSVRGRYEDTSDKVSIGIGNKATGLALDSKSGNDQVKIIALQVKAQTIHKALDGALMLSAKMENDLEALCFVCSRGSNAVLYVGGGPVGTFSKNELYDYLGRIGNQVGPGAKNSKIPYKDIDLQLYGVVIDRESFTERADDVSLLPMSLDIEPARPKTATAKAFEGSNDVYGQSGLVILPVFDAERFDPGYDDHPMVVQYKKGMYLPSVIEYFRVLGVAEPIEYQKTQIVPTGGEWREARNENARVKEASVEDFLTAKQVFSIPYGHECVLVFDGEKATLQVKEGVGFINTPQTLEFELFCRNMSLAPFVAKGVLTPRDSKDFAAVDAIVGLDELPENEFAVISMFADLEVRIFGVLEESPDFEHLRTQRLMALTTPSVKICRNQSETFVEESGRNPDLAYQEMVSDELETGYASRLMLVQDGATLNFFGERTVDAAIIAFDIEGKNPQNGIVGKVVLGLNSIESIRAGDRKKRVELFTPIGVTSSFKGFSVEAKKKMYEHLLEYATHPGYADGYLMIDPVEAGLVVNVEFKGLGKDEEQPVFRHFTEMAELREEFPAVPLWHTKGMGRFELTELNIDRNRRVDGMRKPSSVPKNTYLAQIGKRKMPLLKNPVVTSLGEMIDSLDDYFVKTKDKYSVRSTRKTPLSLPVPIEQIKKNGPEPIVGEFDRSEPVQVSDMLDLSLNPPTENWSAHRQRVPWDFDQDAFDGTAFRTFIMDDEDDRRKAIHMDGWNRRYDDFKGVHAIAGKLNDTGKWHIQTIRVPRHYKLRRLRKEIKLDEMKPPKWYKKLRPNTKPFGTKNPPESAYLNITDYEGYRSPIGALQPPYIENRVTAGGLPIEVELNDDLENIILMRENFKTEREAVEFLKDFAESVHHRMTPDIEPISTTLHPNTLRSGYLRQIGEEAYEKTSRVRYIIRNATKDNPIIPHDYIKAMDRGWTGYPWWAIAPTIAPHELRGNPPDDITITHSKEESPTYAFGIQHKISAHIGNKDVGFLKWEPAFQDVGVIGGTDLQDGEPFIFIGRLEVDENQREKGIGKLLLDVLRGLPQAKGKKIILRVGRRVGLEPNWVKVWYERLGFVETAYSKEHNHHAFATMVLQNPPPWFKKTDNTVSPPEGVPLFVARPESGLAFIEPPSTVYESYASAQFDANIDTSLLLGSEKRYDPAAIREPRWFVYEVVPGKATFTESMRIESGPHATRGRIYATQDTLQVVREIPAEWPPSYYAPKENPPSLACPLATQHLQTNTENRDLAVAAKHIQYGPLNLNDKAYWERYAEKWNTTVEVARKSNCSNCIAFDISPRMKECMPGETSDSEGELGYCWMHHFKCHSARTCNTWAAGGPITSDGVSGDFQKRAQKSMGKSLTELPAVLAANPPKKTPGGKTIPKRYLKGLTKEEMQIAIKEIDKGYKYDIDDPEAYEYWKSDIKATARGYKTVPSKYKKKFIKMYGPLPEKGKFIEKMAKATGIKKSILQKVYDKGLAAWRTGHRPGVQQHQWAAGRVYSFVTLGNTVKKGKKKMSDYTLAVEAGLIKDGKKNPPETYYHGTTLSNARKMFESRWFKMREDWPTFTDSLDVAIRFGVIKWLEDGRDPEDPIVILELDSNAAEKTLKQLERLPNYWDVNGHYYAVMEPIPSYFLRALPYTGEQFMDDYEKMKTKNKDSHSWSPQERLPVPSSEQYRSLVSNWDGSYIDSWLNDPYHKWWNFREQKKHAPFYADKKNPPKKPPFGLFFVRKEDENSAIRGLKPKKGKILKQLGKNAKSSEGEFVELLFPYPNWKENLIPWLRQNKLNPSELSLLKAHIEPRNITIIDDLTFFHKGAIRGDQMEKVVNWVDSIDWESGMITDTPEYRTWMIASGLLLEPNFKPNPVLPEKKFGSWGETAYSFDPSSTPGAKWYSDAQANHDEIKKAMEAHEATIIQYMRQKYRPRWNFNGKPLKDDAEAKAFKEAQVFANTPKEQGGAGTPARVCPPGCIVCWREDAKPKQNPPKEPPTLEEFREWVDLVNMKNKELKAFMDSDWFAVSGLTPGEAKKQGIKSGQDSFRAIIRMRKKLGLRGPKDYIKSGPKITKRFYELALEEWTGPDADVPVDDDLTDWGWMKRQLRFNKRASAFPYNRAQEKRKGPLIKKQKTQNQPSRKLLSLWVWGHDPWRWARKHGVENMPKCPDVPWVGMTEKRKYGKVPVLMGPKKNPHGGQHRVPKQFEGQDPSEHSDLYTDEDPVGTIRGLGFKDRATAEKSVNIIKKSGKTHAHKIQAAMAMEQRARFHPHKTEGIKQAQKVYEEFIEEMKQKTKRNPPPVLDLSVIEPHTAKSKKRVVLTDGKPPNNVFSPMFDDPLSAKAASPSDSIHVVVPGLMPAPTEKWLNFASSKLFYMPNDVKPHLHGAASHHLGDGFKLNRAFLMSAEKFVQTDKRLSRFREKIADFNLGKSATPVETWIHWRIPTDANDYPTLQVRKDSIVWWDYSDEHALAYVKSKERYDKDESHKSDVLIDDNVNQGMNIVVTIMDKVGEFYFNCPVPGHAGLGHKIIIRVVDRLLPNPSSVYGGIKEAHEQYGYPGSHRTGSVVSDGVVVRSYSTGKIDEISADEDTVKYQIKTSALKDAFKLNKSTGKPLRFFLKKADGVHDMGLYDVSQVRGGTATLERAGTQARARKKKQKGSNRVCPHPDKVPYASKAAAQRGMEERHSRQERQFMSVYPCPGTVDYRGKFMGRHYHYGHSYQINPLKLRPLYGDILAVSGPSGSGKSTMAQGLMKKLKGVKVPSYMTREKRPNEKEGIDGVFIDKEAFESMIADGKFTTEQGVDLWVQQKNGEYYGRKASDFLTSKPIIVDVNFDGLRLMRKAFPNKVYSVFIRTNMGEERRRRLLEKRGVHSEEEIEQRVKVGTSMLFSYKDLNFDFISSNKRGELEKNIAMISKEFRNWRNRPMANPPRLTKGTPVIHVPSYMSSLETKEPAHKLFFQSLEVDGDTVWLLFTDEDGKEWRITEDEIDQYSLYPTAPYYKANPPATNLVWEHRPAVANRLMKRPHHTLFGRDETGGGVAVRFYIKDGNSARIESIGLRDQVSMAIDSGVFDGQKLSQKQILELEDLDDGRSGLQLIDGEWVEDLSYKPDMKGKGYGQAAYLKILDYADEIYSGARSAKATRAWEALWKRQKELGVIVERIPRFMDNGKPMGDGFLMKRAKQNPPVFDHPGAMDMGIQYGDKTGPNLEGKAASSKWHNQMLDGKMSTMPEIANDWKKKSFKAEFGLDGFIEKFGDDPRPYIVSLKIDGDSSLAHFDGKETVLWNKRGRWRRNLHVTDEITASLKKAGVSSAIIMGELYAVGEDGMTLSLKEVSSTILKPETMERQRTIRFAAFDLIELNGQDTFSMAYHDRMKLIPKLKGSGVMTVPMWFSKGGLKEVKEAWEDGMKEPNFEGLILRYEGDPKSYKIKEKGTADLAVIGFYRGKAGGRLENSVGGGMLAWMLPNGDFIYAGKSVIGSTDVEKKELASVLLDDAVKAPKARIGGRLVDSSITHDEKGKGAFTMVKPTMVGEFQYRSINWSEKPVFRYHGNEVKVVGSVRAPTMQQPSFKRWRSDKEIKPEHLRIEQIPLEGTGKWGQIKPNPSGDLPEEIEYPGGHAQYLMDGILIGSIEKDLTTGKTQSSAKIGKWFLKHPELAARLIEAEKKGWSVPRSLMDRIPRANPPEDLLDDDEPAEKFDWPPPEGLNPGQELVHLETGGRYKFLGTKIVMAEKGKTGKKIVATIHRLETPSGRTGIVSDYQLRDEFSTVTHSDFRANPPEDVLDDDDEEEEGRYIPGFPGVMGPDELVGFDYDIDEMTTEDEAKREAYLAANDPEVIEYFQRTTNERGTTQYMMIRPNWTGMHERSYEVVLLPEIDPNGDLIDVMEPAIVQYDDSDDWREGLESNPPKARVMLPRIIVMRQYYTPQLLRAYPNYAFLFGDNEQRKGKGGQARIRDEPNAFGVRTKKSARAFWSDKHKDSSVKMMSEDFVRAFSAGYDAVVIPKDGIGTGLAQLEQKAPQTWKWLASVMRELNRIAGMESEPR